MKRTLSIVNILVITTVVSSGIVFFPFNSDLQSQAQGQEESWIENVWRRLTTRPQSDESQTSTNKGGGNRGGLCSFTEEELVAIVPTTPTDDFSYVEKTLSEYPVIRLYVPYEPRQGLNARFEIIDANEDTVYGSTFEIDGTPGIVPVTIPSTQSGLKEGHRYTWIFSVICDSNDQSSDATVDGEIERAIVAQYSSNLSTLSIDERLEFYADNLLWFDFLEALRQQTTGEYSTEWKERWQYLLMQMGFNESRVSGEMSINE